jgi:hypothetical protein
MAAKKATTKKEAAPKKPSLDIKDEMYWADKKRFTWLEEQPEELAKTFSPLVAMKWQSVVFSYNPDEVSDAILNVNEFVNQGFWDLAKHPDLQWRLMCAAGTGVQQRHGWVPLASRKKTMAKVDQVFLNLHPQINDEELALLKSKYDVESFKQLLRDMAMDDKEAKSLVDEFKKTNG